MARLAAEITAIDNEPQQIDIDISDRYEHHPSSESLTSIKGFMPVPATTFLAQTGGNLDATERLRETVRSGMHSGNYHVANYSRQ